MRLVVGKTVQGLRKRRARWRRFEQAVAAGFTTLDAAIDAVVSFADRRFENAFSRFEGSVKQAIADRYATIRNAQEEISELEQL